MRARVEKRSVLGWNKSEHISTKVEVNSHILSTLKNSKSIWSINPEASFKALVVGLLVISVSLVKRQIGQGYYTSGIFSVRPPMSLFQGIRFSLVIETWPKFWWISWESYCFEISHTVGSTIFLSLGGFTLTKMYFNIVDIVLSPIGWSPRATLSINKFTMFKRSRRNLLKSNIKFEGTWWDGVGTVTWKIINWSHCIYNGTVMKST